MAIDPRPLSCRGPTRGPILEVSRDAGPPATVYPHSAVRGTMELPRLFSNPISHYCVSVERMLAFKQLRYERVPVRYDDRQEMIRITGQDYMPALRWDGRTVPWQEIPDFLEAEVPHPTLYPGGQRALARALEHWGHQVVEEKVWRAVVTRVPPVLSAPNEAWVFEEMQTRARGPWHVLELRREEFERDMHEVLGMVNGMLEARPWILGDPSLADFGIYGSISPLFTVGGTVPVEFQHLDRWARAIRQMATPA